MQHRLTSSLSSADERPTCQIPQSFRNDASFASSEPSECSSSPSPLSQALAAASFPSVSSPASFPRRRPRSSTAPFSFFFSAARYRTPPVISVMSSHTFVFPVAFVMFVAFVAFSLSLFETPANVSASQVSALAITSDISLSFT